MNTLEHVAAKTLELNAIGVCNLSLDRPVAFDPYADNRETGGFIVIDRLSNNTVGAGLLHFALRRSHNIHMQHVDVDKEARAGLKHPGAQFRRHGVLPEHAEHLPPQPEFIPRKIRRHRRARGELGRIGDYR